MIQIINLKSDGHIYLKISLKMRFSVVHNELQAIFSVLWILYICAFKDNCSVQILK